MDQPIGFVTLEGLLSLNIAEVQAHLNSVQWPNTNDPEPYYVFYNETRAIFMITVVIDAFLDQTPVQYYSTPQAHLIALRSILLEEHQTRLSFLSRQHGPAQ